MNNFTKEDLEDLLEWGNTYCIDMPTIAKMHHINLLGKIKLMIENYCEHEESVADHNYKVERCKKCGAIFI